MAIDVFKPRGKLKKNQPGAGVASVIQVPIICTVMSTVDPTHQGRIAVYPSENLNKNAYNSDNWLWVGRLATFAGQTAPIGPDETGDYGSYTQNPSSYGQWNAPPDKETQVICIFVNGDPNYGFYIGTIPKPETLSMIPAIGAFENVTLNEGEAQSYGGATRLPTTNINTNNKDVANSVNYLKDAKPVHSFTASIMQQQGVLRDKYRGPIGSSATREASSRVGWGVSTPGRPVYLGGATDEDIPSKLGDEPEDFRVVTRRGGHSLVMDDGDIIGRDQLIRLRTSLGHQILMSDDGQMLSILHSNGQSYIELGKEGTVDVFSTNSVNIRTQGDLNLHADETLNLSAKNVNINSSENTYLNADKEFKQRVGEDYSLYAIQDLKIKADAALAIEAIGQVGIKSDAEIFNEGTKIHLNDGAASLSPDVVEPIEVIMHPDTLFDDTKGWAAALAKLPSITSRAPAHMPWMNANQGADVQVDPSAAGALPTSPTDTIADLNSALAGDLGGPTSLPNPATAASISEVSGISKALDKNATSQMLSGALSNTIDDLGSSAVSLGGTLTNMTNNAIGTATTAAVGLFGQTPSQMAQGGILKPGADTMVNTLISANAGDIGSKTNEENAIPGVSNPIKTATLSSVMPASIFSGKAGVNSLEQFTNSSGAQAKSAVQVMQKGQKSLQTLGAMTGKESPGGVGAIVQGTMSTLSDKGNLTNNVKNVSTIITESVGSNDNIPASASQVLKSMKTGASAMLASELSGGTGGIISALDTLNTSGLNLPGVGADLNIGAAASSFKSIVNSFPVLPANTPIDLAATAGAAAAAVAGASAGMTGLDLVNTDSISSGLAAAVGAGSAGIDTFSGALTTASGAAAQIAASGDPGAVAAINSAVNDISAIAGDPTTLTQQGLLQAAALNVQTGTSSKISGAIASGVSQLPGGQSLAGSIVNNAIGAVNPLSDGLGKVTNALADLGGEAFAGIDAGNIAFEGASGLGSIKDAAGAMTDQLTGKVAGALSSALSPGTTAALQSALSSLTAGGGSTIKLPVVAINTYDRSSITNLIDSVLDDIVPKPNLLGEIPSGTLSAINSITQLKKTLSKDIQQLSVLSKGIAKKKSALFEAQSNFPAGSPEIAAAEAAYQQAASSTTYTTLVQKVKAAQEQFNTVSVDLTIQPETNPFSDIENLLDSASSGGNTADSFAVVEGGGTGELGTTQGTDTPTNTYGLDSQIASGVDPNIVTLGSNDLNTYSNILATVAKTYVSNDKTQYQSDPYSTDYKPVIAGYPAPDNTVESVIGGGNADPGIGQEGGVYTDYGIITINENIGVDVGPYYGGGYLKWYYDGISWKLK